jgi:endonuclease YncB( thermonuclease family)
MTLRLLGLTLCLLLASACGNLEFIDKNDNTGGNTGGNDNTSQIDGEQGRVVQVIDGDTIDVELEGETYRVRYVGVNTPERDETCYAEATAANRRLVEGKTVTLVLDTSETDRYDRLLRYIYVGNTFVNRELLVQGYAEAVLYQPDDQYFNAFHDLEVQAAQAGRGCHPTGIFNDGSDTR